MTSMAPSLARSLSLFLLFISFSLSLATTTVPSHIDNSYLASNDIWTMRQAYETVFLEESDSGEIDMADHFDTIRSMVAKIDSVQFSRPGVTINKPALSWWTPSSQDTATHMKICIVTSSLEGLYLNSGIGTTYAALAELLAQQGHDVVVLYTREERTQGQSFHDWVLFYREKGVTLTPLPPSKVRIDGSYAVRKSFEVYLYLKNKNFDMIHFPDFEGPAFYSLQAKTEGLAFSRTTMVVGLHGPTRWVMGANIGASLSQESELEVDFMERRSVELADMVWTPSVGMVDWLVKQNWTFPARTYLLPLPPGPEVRAALNDNTPLEETKTKEIVFFGRLETRKGLELFLDAMDLLAGGAIPDVQLSTLRVTFLGRSALVGKQSASDLIQSRSKNWPFASVSVLTDKSRSDALRYLREPGQGRLAIIPSLVDNAPYTVYECLYTNTPFLASNLDSISPLMASEDQSRVLFDSKPHLLVRKLAIALRKGMSPVKPVYTADQVDTLWSSFYAYVQSNPALNNPVYSPSTFTASDAPLVSVVLVHFNRPAYLEQAIASIKAQTYPNLEVILVDDGSNATDALRYLDSLEPQFKTKGWTIIRSTNRYLGAARNTGARAAKGTHIMFLDDDNYAQAHEIATYMAVALNTGAHILTSPHAIFHGNDLPSSSSVDRYWLPIGASASVGLFRNCFGDANFFVQTAAFIASGGFTEEYLVGLEDGEYLAKMVLNGYRLEVVPEPMLYYRIHNRDNQMLFKTDPTANMMRYLRPFHAALSAEKEASQPLMHTMMRTLAKRSLTNVLDCNQTISAIDPSEGPISGGTKVVISGSGFTCGVQSVEIGGLKCIAVDVVHNNELTCVTPAGEKAGSPVDVSVDVNGEVVSLYAAFTYTALGTPMLQACQLSDSGVSIKCTFDVATNRAASSDCSRLLTSGTISMLGSGPSCSWGEATHLDISLGSDATIVFTDYVEFLPNVVFAQGDGGQANPGQKTLLLRPTNPVSAVPVIRAPSAVGPCDDLPIDAKSSTGAAGRKLTYVWSLSSVTPSTVAGASDVESTLQAATTDSVSFGSSSLAEATYVFALTATNWLGLSGSSSATVVRSSQNVPKVSIAGSALVSVVASTDLFLEGSGTTSSCDGASSGQANLNYQWSVSPSIQLDTSSASTATLHVPAGSLTAGVTYTFTLTGSAPSNPELSNDASIRVAVHFRPIVALINGGGRQYSTEDAITLDASESTDPDNAGPLSFQWSCVDFYEPSRPCSVNMGPDSSVSFRGDQLGTGKYTFSVAVNSVDQPLVFANGASRGSTASSSIEIQSIAFIAISIQPVPNAQQVSPFSPLSLVGKIESTNVAPDTLTWQWNLVSGDLAVSADQAYSTDMTSSTLTINANSLIAGVSYTYELVATTITGVSGSASTSFTMSSVAKGSVSCPSNSGSALSSSFTFDFGPDDDVVSYLLVFVDGATEVPLGERSLDPSWTTDLPSGSNLQVVGYQYSSSGVSARQFCTVNVGGASVDSVRDTLSSSANLDVYEVTRNLQTAANAYNSRDSGAMSSVKSSGLGRLASLASGTMSAEFVSATVFSMKLITDPSTGIMSGGDISRSVSVMSSLIPSLQSPDLAAGTMDVAVTVLGNLLAQVSRQSPSATPEQVMAVVNLVSQLASSMMAGLTAGQTMELNAGGVTIVLTLEQAGSSNALGTAKGSRSTTSSFSMPGSYLDTTMADGLGDSDMVGFVYTSFDSNPFGLPSGFESLSPVFGLDLSSSGSALPVQGLANPITIKVNLPSMSNDQKATAECVFWDTTTNQWSTSGVTSTPKDGAIECTSTHLTHFTVRTAGKDSWWTTGRIVGISIGGAALVAIIIGGSIFAHKYRRRRAAARANNAPPPPPPSSADVPASGAPITPVAAVAIPSSVHRSDTEEEPELVRPGPIRPDMMMAAAIHEHKDDRSAEAGPSQVAGQFVTPHDIPVVVSEFNQILREFEQKERDGLLTPPGTSPANNNNNNAAASSSRKHKFGPYGPAHDRAARSIQSSWRRYQSQIDRRREAEIEQLLDDIDELLADESDPFDLDELDMN
eukprot:TRINITY_DN1227_c0_g1_i1.p1 TRINITY_DN1227_c0_g1~~TRINITY_DN1227_c0_g1_i1.p1  ORF type:complete len:2051 (+),score=596.77 TRINITY_DN1227_c0_g1_i1:131-6283(+)